MPEDAFSHGMTPLCLSEVLLMNIINACFNEETGKYLGPVVQSIVSLTSLLVVKILTILISTISNVQVFLLKKCEKLLTFFQQKN